MRHATSTALGFGAFVLAVSLLGCGSPEPTSQEMGEREAAAFEPPEIDLVTVEEIRGLIDAGRGSIVVVNFWATWCPPCVKEMPQLARFYEAFDTKGTIFLSFSADDPSTLEDRVRPFVNSYEIPFPVHVMHVEDPTELGAALKVDWDGGLPATFVFASDGSLARSWVGEITYEILAEAVGALRDSPEVPADSG